MKKTFSLLLCIVIAATFSFILADPVEVEIQLIEVSGVGFIEGDSPFDDPGAGGPVIPPRPNDFHATITGNALEVTVDNTNSTNLIVRNASGNVVVNSQFVSLTSEFLSTSGNYSLEIHNGGLTLIGQFVVQ